MHMANLDLDHNPPPFWKMFGFFFRYLKQEKLYYQITLLAAANVLLSIPSLILMLLISALLFLASYKLAFEVLHKVSSGQLEYDDYGSYEIDDKIGFKAITMAVLQLIIFIFIYRRDPPTGTALLIITTGVTPAFLMMLSKTQSIGASFNPMNLHAVMSRIGFEYYLLLAFFLLCAAANLAFKYYTAELLSGVIGDVISAWVLYFLLVFTFLVIGYVMYRHADELGQDTVDTEIVQTVSPDQEDPIKIRIKSLINNNKPAEAIAIINDLKHDDGRIDLDSYLSQAENMLIIKNRQRPAEKLAALVNEKQYKPAITMIQDYLADGHFIKPEQAQTISQLIRYAFDNNQHKVVLQLTRDFDKRYPLEHEQIVDNFFMVAKIYYQFKKTEQAEKLLSSLVKKYSQTTNTKAVSSYLKGIQKLKGA